MKSLSMDNFRRTGWNVATLSPFIGFSFASTLNSSPGTTASKVLAICLKKPVIWKNLSVLGIERQRRNKILRRITFASTHRLYEPPPSVTFKPCKVTTLGSSAQNSVRVPSKLIQREGFSKCDLRDTCEHLIRVPFRTRSSTHWIILGINSKEWDPDCEQRIYR